MSDLDTSTFQHGTRSGYTSHMRTSVEPCEACRAAHRSETLWARAARKDFERRLWESLSGNCADHLTSTEVTDFLLSGWPRWGEIRSDALSALSRKMIEACSAAVVQAIEPHWDGPDPRARFLVLAQAHAWDSGNLHALHEYLSPQDRSNRAASVRASAVRSARRKLG